MDSLIEISDDEDSFDWPGSKAAENSVLCGPVELSSDDDDKEMGTINMSNEHSDPEGRHKENTVHPYSPYLEYDVITDRIPLNNNHVQETNISTECTLTDDEDLPEVTIQKKNAIKSLFPSTNSRKKIIKQTTVKALFAPKKNAIAESEATISNINPTETLKRVINRMIAGVNVQLPVDPYGSQVALMSKIITGIKKGQNCILESPTGSGKTLALLCGALAWQQYEQNRLSQNQMQQYFTTYPELKKEGVAEYIGTPTDQKTKVTPEKLFSKNNFGEKSIYYKPEENGESSTSNHRQEKTPYRENSEDEPSCENQVTIHKRPRLGSVEYTKDNKTPTCRTPEKNNKTNPPETPECVRNLYALVENLRVRTSMFIGCSLPTIYYGARTHTQLKQVIKEFKRTSYCGIAKMTVLSSRDKSCIREFDKNQWRSREDMCRDCVKPFTQNNQKERTNCKYYDNRASFNHGSVPPAFDLEDLVEIGRDKDVCPYYGARGLAKTANIVFCPYNYLIDPSIRSSVGINLENNVVIIDEAHNIEDICRDAASVDISRAQIQTSIKELEKVAESRFANHQVMSYVESLLNTLKTWDYWFENQTPLVQQQAVNNDKAEYKWKVEDFVTTLNNHNIGNKHYNEFKQHSENFCSRLREDPRTLLGVTQATGTLLESLNMGLGFLFRENCAYMDDFKPALVRHVGRNNSVASNISWRASQFNKSVMEETLTLSLVCLNPAIVMQQLHSARCIAIASGTLTPLVSLHSELGTSFPHSVSPNHVIPPDRIWIGTLMGNSSGHHKYDSAGIRTPQCRQALGKCIIRVCRLTPHGVLCFLPSYTQLTQLVAEWRQIGMWDELNRLKHVFCEKKNGREHEETMNEFYETVETQKGALLFAVYRGKVSEGMDFKDRQARAVICVGVPFPNTYDIGVKAKMDYNDKYTSNRQLLPGKDWLRVQAYRALNQAVGRCVRHRGDWGAVLLVDARYNTHHYTDYLSNWVKRSLGTNHHTYESLLEEPNGLAAFMEKMKAIEEEEGLV